MQVCYGVCMVRTSISLPDDLWELVRVEAFTRKVSQTEVIRTALRGYFTYSKAQPHDGTVRLLDDTGLALPYERMSDGGAIPKDLFHPGAPKRKSKDPLPKVLLRR